MTTFEATVFIVIMGTLFAFIAWLLWQAGRGMVRYYRDNRPRRMATRVTRSRWEDSKRPDNRDWQGAFKRIVSGK